MLGAASHPGVATYGDESDRMAAAGAWAVERLGRTEFEAFMLQGANHDSRAAAQRALEVIARLSR